MSTFMKKCGGGPIDLSDLMGQAGSDEFVIWFEEQGIFADLPYKDGATIAPNFDDPLTIRISIPLGEDADSSPYFSVGLGKLVAGAIDNFYQPGHVMDRESAATLSEFSTALRQLAEQIDAAIEQGSKTE